MSPRDGVALFERGARERPGEPAILYLDSVISHAEADAQAHAFAAALRERLGLTAGDRVALMLQNDPQVSIAVHAVWLAGGIVTMVNPMNKRRELLHQLNDAGVRVVVCLESLYETVDAVRDDTPVEHVVTASPFDYLGSDPPPALVEEERRDCPGSVGWHELLGEYAGRRVDPARPQEGDPAFITYTSGTTGRAQGCDQHARRPRPQRGGDDALGLARSRRRHRGDGAALPHHGTRLPSGDRPHEHYAAAPHAPLRAGRAPAADRAAGAARGSSARSRPSSPCSSTRTSRAAI